MREGGGVPHNTLFKPRYNKIAYSIVKSFIRNYSLFLVSYVFIWGGRFNIIIKESE